MKLSGVWLSVCLSIHPIIQPLLTAAASLLLWAVQAGDIDGQLWCWAPKTHQLFSSSGTAARRSAANASGSDIPVTEAETQTEMIDFSKTVTGTTTTTTI